MQFSDDLEFTVRERKEVYDFVERHGRVDYHRARRALGMDESAFGHYVSSLEHAGFVARHGDELRVALESAEPEQFGDGIDFRIRQATEDDLEQVVEAVRAALSDGVYIVAENFAGEIDRERAVLRHNELRSRVVFLATVGDEVIGWVHLDAPEQHKLDHTAEMTVGVVPDYRGRGVGGRLMDRGVRWAREHGYEKLYNSVPSTNQRAIDWLETRGWEVEAVRENHYRVGGEYVDEVMMARWP